MFPFSEAPLRVSFSSSSATSRKNSLNQRASAQASATALQSLDPELSALLQSIQYSSATVVALGYRRDQIQHPLNGFGFLVPKKERNRMTACTWVSSKWDHRAPADGALFRCFVGDTEPGAETEAAEGVWKPPRGGSKVQVLAGLVQQVLQKGGVADEVLDGLDAVELT